MRISELPMRDVNGIAMRDLPMVRKDSMRGFAVGICVALDYVREARKSPIDDEWAAILALLEPTIEDVEDIDLDLLEESDIEQVMSVFELSTRLARTHDVLWYPKSEAISDAFMAEHPMAKFSNTFDKAHYQTMLFLDDIPKHMSAWGASCTASMQEDEFARLHSGLYVYQALESKELQAAIEKANADRQEVVAMENRSVIELVEILRDELSPATPRP